MKINSLKIKDFCILKDFEINFENDLSVLIGENGSGKSSVLEVIALIFGHLHKYFVLNDKKSEFIDGYCINFTSIIGNTEENNNYVVEIESISHQDENEDTGIFNHRISINGNELTIRQANAMFKEVGGFKVLLPSSIVLYYAGITQRLEKLGKHFEDKYWDKSITSNNTLTNDILNLPKFRPFFYLKREHLSNILLCLMVSENPIAKNICSIIDINNLENYIDIYLKKPAWAKKDVTSVSFWGAKAGSSKDFLSILSTNSYENLFDENEVKITYVSALNVKDMLGYFDVENREAFLFKALDILMTDGLLDYVDLSWKNSKNEIITIDRLSEGEKQMILTSGLVALWSEENSLLLFDEPDTFLHPKWQAEFIPRLSENLKGNQAIVTTHSPLSLSALKDGELIVMKNGKSLSYSDPIYGKDTNTLLSLAMGASIRDKRVEQMIINIESLIKENKLELSKSKIYELESIMEDKSDPTLIRFLSIITRKELIGR